ncbi:MULTISPECIES: hypothetical protein [Streptomyces]|uniref:Integral membrane protein n=1 Tax=Streptomyces venezuelae TaxID=54571 RepID=A0A5P2B7T3_STRVZ|nr:MULTISPECIES: hypothetical protein [Streptomyces]NDZ98526.1 hypothetical protein [Streptomyces sp. SID10116]MYY79747.1 hypothetical protein [Streptomyces sp. SID335]MYZ16549.1 hypothetical protein [Streptomyces sp. SID337]NDZ84516.1 hypothetical protein [Streptomyces sp. SID10115]NEB43479.1 hypothetical protein [Streptomyces sp. SID339]
MKPTIRRIAVSGSAAVALLGGATALGAATAPTASAADMDTAITRATGAPVNMPDGRTTYVRGMDAATYRISDEHTRTITLAAAKTEDDPGSEISNGLTPGERPGSGAALDNPNQPNVNGPTGTNPQEIQTQASGGTIAVSIVAILILGILVWVKVKHSGLKAMDAALGVLLGIALSGTIIGSMGSQMTNSLVGSLGTMLSGMG